MTAWMSVAAQRVKAVLLADPRLSLYVDSVAIRFRLTSDKAADFIRHGIEIAFGSLAVAPHGATSVDETMTLNLRLWIAGWTFDEEELLTANDTTGGVGASEVGLVQFIEDVAGAVRLNGLVDGSGFRLVEPTGLEAGAYSDLSVERDPERDRLFVKHDIALTFLHVRDFE